MDRRLFLALCGGLAAARPADAAAQPLPLPLRRLSLYNPNTRESFAGPYRDEKGPIPAAMAELSHFLRDFHCGAEIAIDPAVLDFLAAVMAAVGAGRATILSAYRTPATNRMLARTMFGVADNSQHLYGRALDIRVDRIETAMQAARAMRRGGVGWYPRSGFIHIDSGPVRHWTLDGTGLDELLWRRRQLLADNGLPSDLLALGAHHPLSVRQRLALGRVLARAEFLARHR
ncbi:MAG TPA: DUF882 domain-containing protein [Stellaceae bacterium]|nr:DUF882 domain-containing protein [Stellaceae bacterium]